MKKIILSILFLCAPAAQAADSRYCDHYAQTAVKQQVANIAHSCNQTGLRWSPLYVGQKKWCATVRREVADKETKARNAALLSCGTNMQKINWNKLPHVPGVWDALFAQMLAATKKDDVVAVKVMHANGVSIHHEEGFNNGTLFYHAVDIQAEKVSEYLLSQGAKVDESTPNGGGSALSRMLSDAKINHRMLAMLLRMGVDPNAVVEGYSDSVFPLIAAVENNHQQAVQMLLNAKANPNLFRDNPALHYAVDNRNMNIVKMLVNAGADVNAKDLYGVCTTLDKARKSGSQGIINYLKSRGAKPGPNCQG
ncbi:MAG: ankyrin repeat domain-containing protein [Thiolinea sp.]